MKVLIGLWILFKNILIIICLMVCLPLAYCFPEFFVRGITNFQYRCIDDLERCGLYTKEEADEMRENVDD